MSVFVASTAAAGLTVAIGFAPPASATPCEAAEANIDPPANSAPMPAPQPVVRPPTGRRPPNANDRAPLPKLGPLISSLLRPTAPGTTYSAPMTHQAEVVPPGPNPPGGGAAPPPANAAQLAPNAAPVQPQPAPHP